MDYLKIILVFTYFIGLKYAGASIGFECDPLAVNFCIVDDATITDSEFDDTVFEDLPHLKFSNSEYEIMTPKLMDTFPNLNVLEIVNSHLKQILPNSFLTAGSLGTINLRGNLLEKLYDKIFDGAVNLVVMDLSENKISEIDPEVFYYVPNLKILNLESNLIHKLENSIFDKLSKLTTISLAKNLIQFIEPHIFINNLKLKSIHLENNKIKKIVPYDTFGHLHLLKDVNIGYNTFVDFVKIDAWNISLPHSGSNGLYIGDANYIDASFNDIHFIIAEPDILRPNGLTLKINNNNLYDLRNLSDVNNIDYLDASNNLIDFFDFNILEKSPHINEISLSHNHLLYIVTPVNGTYFKNLKVLDLTHNHLRRLDAIIFYSLPNLQDLFLDYNKLQTFEINRISKDAISNLHILGLTNNQWNCDYLLEIITYLKDTTVTLKIDDFVENRANHQGINCVFDDSITEYLKRHLYTYNLKDHFDLLHSPFNYKYRDHLFNLPGYTKDSIIGGTGSKIGEGNDIPTVTISPLPAITPIGLSGAIANDYCTAVTQSNSNKIMEAISKLYIAQEALDEKLSILIKGLYTHGRFNHTLLSLL